MRPKDLFSYLQASGWIYRRPGGSGYLGYQSKVTTGLIEHKITTILRGDGSEQIIEQARITAKGLTKLAALMHPAAKAA
jgi:anti-repressor protein